MTADEINALPDKAREFVHALEANADPAGMVRENILIREENQALRVLVAQCAAVTNAAQKAVKLLAKVPPVTLHIYVDRGRTAWGVKAKTVLTELREALERGK